MPAAASSGACPFFTKANAKISTHEIAKNSVVVSTSRLLTSIAKSLRSTSHAVRRNTSGGSDQGPVARAQPARRRLVGEQPAAADQHHAVDEAVRQIEIVCREHDDGAAGRQRTEPIGDDADGAVVEAGERFVE